MQIVDHLLRILDRRRLAATRKQLPRTLHQLLLPAADHRRMNPKFHRQLRQGLLPRKRRHRHARLKGGAVLLPLYTGQPLAYPTVQKTGAAAVHDVDYAATPPPIFPELSFIVEHVGLPRLDDFCWIAAQESNVYAELSVAMAFVHLRPRYFAEIMANLLFWLGPDKLCFGSDYAIWSPKWLIEKFMAFEMPEDLKQEYHVDLTFDIKRKILGENTARLYGIDIPAQTVKLIHDGIGLAR